MIPATRARRRGLLAVAIVVVVLAGGLALAVSLRPPASSRAATTPVVSASQRGTASARGLGQPRVPQISLAGLRWYDFHGVELPFSATAGPRDIRREIAAGFAHDPLGALLAAVNIAVRANAQWGPRIFTTVIRGQITGPGAAALLANCQTFYDQASRSEGVTGGQPLGHVHVAEEAFRWVAYTPAAAVIDLVSAAPGPQGTTVRASTQLQVVWDGGDWKVIAPPGGDWGNSAAELSSLSGYTLFSGQGGGR
ncbi:MAG TPA: hypothetical protein VFX25_27860 [Streptosporangiaceae bacterium]|nr:hypothetical protein [Streptosporangiaceae bacterium]